MKKAILNLLMLFAVTGVATAQSVTIADVEACHGRTEKITATLELSAPADTYTGFQLSIQFPATGFSIAADAVTGWPGSIEYGTMTAGEVNFAAASSKTFSAVNLNLEFTVDGSLALGEYPVTVSGQFEGAGVADAPIDDVIFKVIVTDRITLDEKSTALPIERAAVNVKVKRTINANEWSTICLPFAMTKTKFQNAFGSDAILKEYKGYTTEMDWDTYTPTSIVLNFDDFVWANALTKTAVGTPYLIKTTKAIESFDVNNVTIITELNDVSAGDNNGFAGKFKGVIAKTTVPDKGLFISGNKFYYSTGKTNIKAFRGWFNLEAIYNVPFEIDARIDFNFDETTGIKEVHGNANAEGTYDLQGRKVEEPTNKGLYIVNGKKVVIK